jgi:hypothetical protein
MDAVLTRRVFSLSLLPLLRAFSAETKNGEILHGKLTVGPTQAPGAESAAGHVSLDSDEANLKVLHDERINGFDMEARGHYTAPGHFQIDPQHTRSILLKDRDGRMKMVTYWCDICSIRTYIPGPCMCCQKYTDLDLRPPDDIR